MGAAAVIAVIVGPVRAQTPPPPGAYPPQPPPAPYAAPYRYPFAAPTPRDAYREGQINRWEYERLEGPLPPALQGPSPDGSRGGGPGV